MKKRLITAILQTISFGGGYISGDLFFMLAFRTIPELKDIARELNINTENL